MEELVKPVEPELPNLTQWTQRERLAKEREVLGFYVTDHPLRKFEIEYKSFSSIQLGDTEKLQDTDVVRACGVITELKTKIDKSNRKMAFFKLDDFSGSCECLMFSKVFENYGQYIKEEECVLIIGKPESSGDAIKLHIDKVIPLQETKKELTESIKINIDKKRHPLAKISELKTLLETNEGNIPLYIDLVNNGSKPSRFTLPKNRINLTDQFILDVNNCLGEDSLLLVCKK
jgi:DNA polymerase-3 subunit alpha